MPKYDFKCKACQKEFTLDLAMKDRNNGVCPSCNSSVLDRVYKNINVGKLTGNSNNSPGFT